MRITSKGRVTIPKAVREKLGLRPHTEIEFVVVGDVAQVRKVRRRRSIRGKLVVERLRGSGNRKLTSDQIMALTRGD